MFLFGKYVFLKCQVFIKNNVGSMKFKMFIVSF